MKKPKTKKPRANRRTRAERKKNSGRAALAPVGTIERRPPVEEGSREERVYIRFGEPPKGGFSQNGVGATRGWEAGVSCFLGRRVINGKGGVSYVIDVPAHLLLHQLTRQGQYLLVMLSEGRPVYVLEEGEEVGVGADGEPVLAGSTPRLVPTFARVELPEWFGKEGRAFADRWNRLRRTPKFHNSLDARHAGLRSLQAAYETLVKQVVEKAAAIVEERGICREELLALSNGQEEIRAADPRGVRNHYKNPLLTREQQRALSGEGPRFRVLEDPFDFEARERRLLRALGEDPEEERSEAVSGEGVPLVERVLDRATVAARNSKVHGPEHWKRVAVAGLELCRETPGADPFSVLQFSLFHDSQRYTDSSDPGHGRRGGAMARELLEEDGVSADRVDLIVDACAKHTAGQVSPDPTVGVCWDADRLNLWRVGSRPSPALLSTEAARSLERIDWARELQERPCSWAEIFESYDDFNREA